MITFETTTTACGTYRRGVLAGCVLLPHDDEQAQRSYIPMTTFLAVQCEFPRANIVHRGLAARLGVAMVIGDKASLDRLEAQRPPACAQVQAEIRQARALGLGHDAEQWFDSTDRIGACADAVFGYLTGADCIHAGAPSFPDSRFELSQLALLRASVQIVDERFDRLRELGKPWHALCVAWPDLISLLGQGADKVSVIDSTLSAMVGNGDWSATGVFLKSGRLQKIEFGRAPLPNLVRYTIDGRVFIALNHKDIKADLYDGCTVQFRERAVDVLVGEAKLPGPALVEIVAVSS